jgi:hypothetical protein
MFGQCIWLPSLVSVVWFVLFAAAISALSIFHTVFYSTNLQHRKRGFFSEKSLGMGHHGVFMGDTIMHVAEVGTLQFGKSFASTFVWARPFLFRGAKALYSAQKNTARR